MVEVEGPVLYHSDSARFCLAPGPLRFLESNIWGP